MNWIAWDKALANLQDGGLSIGSLKAHNLALLGKWWWRFKENKQELWKCVVKSIYGIDGGLDAPSSARRKGWCWGSIVNITKKLGKDGIDFRNLFQADSATYQWTWRIEASGKYTVSSLRHHIDDRVLPKAPVQWTWNGLVPRKVNILSWRVAHGRIPTRTNLVKKGIGDNPNCILCGKEEETEEHIFLKCQVSYEVWQNLKSWWQFLPDRVVEIGDLLSYESNMGSNGVQIQACDIPL